jgi:hypothetical protein
MGEFDLHLAVRDFFRTGVFLPGHPIIRNVATNYSADIPIKAEKLRRQKKEELEREMSGNCGNFDIKTHQRILMIFVCTGCKKVIGFVVLDEAESPKALFEIFYSRFSSAPNVLYDNACNFDLYCKSREPVFFAQMKANVDRFHHDNHVRCSDAYKLDQIYDFPLRHSGVNSQSCEQTNSALSDISSQLK